jgi:predicted proteasome-type protease
MMIYERPGDRFMVMLSAGNLSISQQVREILQIQQIETKTSRRSRSGTRRACSTPRRVLGAAVRRVYDQDGEALQKAGLDFNASLILGGPDRRRVDAPLPRLFGGQLHRGDTRDLLSSRSASRSTASPCSTG